MNDAEKEQDQAIKRENGKWEYGWLEIICWGFGPGMIVGIILAKCLPW